MAVLREPWAIRKGAGRCDDAEYAVVNRDTGRVVGCHATRRRARAQLAALASNVDERRRLRDAAVALLEAAPRVDKWRRSRPIEREGADRVARVFRAQGRAFVAELRPMRRTFTEARRLPVELREAPDGRSWDAAWRRASRRTRADFADTLEWIARAGMTAGAEAVSARLGIESAFDLQNPRAIDFMQAHGADLVTRIDETTRVAMRQVLTEAVSKGWSYQRTAREIASRFAGFATRSPLAHIASRAELVAVTETAFAYEAGNRLAADTLRRGLPPGLGMRKQWITAGDTRVDEEQCTPNEADGWIPFEESHTSGHTEPPAHPGCRCTEAYDVAAR